MTPLQKKLYDVLKDKPTPAEAARVLGVSERRIYQLIARLRKKGYRIIAVGPVDNYKWRYERIE